MNMRCLSGDRARLFRPTTVAASTVPYVNADIWQAVEIVVGRCVHGPVLALGWELRDRLRQEVIREFR